MAIYHGLAISWDPGYRIVECQSDFLNAVGLVLSTLASWQMYASLIWDIKDLMDHLRRVKLVHELQEGIACADFLAKHGFHHKPSRGVG